MGNISKEAAAGATKLLKTNTKTRTAAIAATRAIAKADATYLPKLTEALKATIAFCNKAEKSIGKAAWDMLRDDVIAARIAKDFDGDEKEALRVCKLGQYKAGSNDPEKRTKDEQDRYQAGKMWFSRVLSKHDLTSPHANAGNTSANGGKTAAQKAAEKEAEKAAEMQKEIEKAATAQLVAHTIPAANLTPRCGNSRDKALAHIDYLMAMLATHAKKNAKTVPAMIINGIHDLEKVVTAYKKEIGAE